VLSIQTVSAFDDAKVAGGEKMSNQGCVNLGNLSGCITELVTPFANGELDIAGLQTIIAIQLRAGVKGISLASVTGEGFALRDREETALLKACVKEVAGQTPIYAAVCSNSTADAISRAKTARDNGAAAVILPTPYYNKPSNDGVVRHFEAIHDALGSAIIIDNSLGRSAIELSIETLKRLCDLPLLVAIKDGGMDSAGVSSRVRFASRRVPVFSGLDAATITMISQGASGCFSRLANVVPEKVVEIVNQALLGNYRSAWRLNDALLPLHSAVALDETASGIKHALCLMGQISEEVRLPFVPATSMQSEAIRGALHLA
jgi:4-hydroxy-tetrahydrodipicolinate synthase